MNFVGVIYFIASVINMICAVSLVALPDLIRLDSTRNIVIRLKGYDLMGSQLSYMITRKPVYGELYQLSHVYSNYGYNPIAGRQMNENDVIDTAATQRIYYSLPYNIYTGCFTNFVESFAFVVMDNTGSRSYESNITITNGEGVIICSDFLLGIDGWTIVGNKRQIENPAFEPYSRGLYLNHYIYSTDDKINVDKNGDSDKSMWFFNAPAKFLGNMGVAYGGYIQFSVGVFVGDVQNINYGKRYNLIELESSKYGITIVFPLTKNMVNIQFKNNTALFKIPLVESRGWVEDPHNILLDWTPPSKCDFIRVLSSITAFRILGDITRWYETIAIDNVYITNTKYNIPKCAATRPDFSICSC